LNLVCCFSLLAGVQSESHFLAATGASAGSSASGALSREALLQSSQTLQREIERFDQQLAAPTTLSWERPPLETASMLSTRGGSSNANVAFQLEAARRPLEWDVTHNAAEKLSQSSSLVQQQIGAASSLALQAHKSLANYKQSLGSVKQVLDPLEKSAAFLQRRGFEDVLKQRRAMLDALRIRSIEEQDDEEEAAAEAEESAKDLVLK